MSKLPIPKITQLDDDSLAFEWHGNDCRVGFYIEQDITQSGWHYVSRHEKYPDEEQICEELSKMNVNKFIECIKKTEESKNEKL